MKTEVRVITPILAKEMLKRNIGNRKKSDAHIRFLSSEMKNGNWLMDGQPLRFTDNGGLLDGQHRLNAVIHSGLSQEFLILTGIKQDAFKVMDTGKGRSAGDILAIKGYTHSTHLSAAVKRIIGHYSNNNGAIKSGRHFSNSSVLEFLEKNEKLVSIAKESKTLHTGFNHVMKFSDIIMYKFLFSDKDVVSTDIFFSKLCYGLDLEKNSPIRVLRDLLIKDRLSKSSLPSREVKALVIKAWNKFRLNESARFLRWNNEVEKFPTIL